LIFVHYQTPTNHVIRDFSFISAQLSRLALFLLQYQIGLQNANFLAASRRIIVQKSRKDTNLARIFLDRTTGLIWVKAEAFFVVKKIFKNAPFEPKIEVDTVKSRSFHD